MIFFQLFIKIKFLMKLGVDESEYESESVFFSFFCEVF